MKTEKIETEAEKFLAALYEKHRDVIDPLIERVNRCTVRHDGDGIFYLHQTLVEMARAIREMIQAGTVIPAAGPETRSRMN